MADYFTLEINENTIKLIEAELSGKQINLSYGGMMSTIVNIFNTETDDAQNKLVKDISLLVKDSGVKKTKVNIIIPDSQSYSSIIKMPRVSEKELISAIKYQADQLIPVPIDTINLDIEILHDNPKDKEYSILLIASPKKPIDRIEKVCELAGLYPYAIETSLSSSLRFFELESSAFFINNQNLEAKPILLANIGSTHTSLILFDLLTLKPIQIHSIPIGVNLFVKAIQANSTNSAENALKLVYEIGFEEHDTYKLDIYLSGIMLEMKTEIERFVVSIKDKLSITPQGIFFYGEGSKIKNLSSKLATNLAIPHLDFSHQAVFKKNPVYDFFTAEIYAMIACIGGCFR